MAELARLHGSADLAQIDQLAEAEEVPANFLAQILLDLGLKKIRPLTNNPRKLVGLEGYGLVVDERVAIVPPATDENAGYLDAKREKLGHLLVS